MTRSRFVALLQCVAFVCGAFLSGASPMAIAQDGQSDATQSGATQPGFTPSPLVQDEGTLTDKASFFVGFKMMKDLEGRQPGEVNMKELFEGMQAASQGDQKKSYVVGYQLMTDLQRQGGDKVDMEELIAGMKAAAAGEDKKNFVAGYQMMSGMNQQGYGLNLDKIFEGMTTASSGKELGMSDEQVQALMSSFQKVVEKRQIEKMKAQSQANGAATQAYMAENAKKPNVKMLENGVQYEVLTEGTGALPTASDKVRLDYHGTFLDGKVFDSSIAPISGGAPAPIELEVGRFVPGFSAALQQMKVGSKWRVVIPGQLAYGASGGPGGMIGPNQALVFEISLLDIVK